MSHYNGKSDRRNVYSLVAPKTCGKWESNALTKHAQEEIIVKSFMPRVTLCKLQITDDAFFETQGKFGVRFVFYINNLESCIYL